MSIKTGLIIVMSMWSVLSFADQQPTSETCKLGCDAPAKCTSLVDTAKYQLWSVGVVTANPHPGDYQIESYGIDGTPASPGHLIFITYGYVDSKNPSGGCEIVMIDGVNVSPMN
jgi:hypothetical protein